MTKPSDNYIHSNLRSRMRLKEKTDGGRIARVRPHITDKPSTITLFDRITILPEICHGKPTIRGLRYPVEPILELLSGGMTTEEILVDYPDLEREDILAVLAFAARLSQIKRLEPLAA